MFMQNNHYFIKTKKLDQNLSVHRTTLTLIVTSYASELSVQSSGPNFPLHLYLCVHIYFKFSVSSIQEENEINTAVFYIKELRGTINNKTSLSLCSLSIMYSFMLLKSLSIVQTNHPFIKSINMSMKNPGITKQKCNPVNPQAFLLSLCVAGNVAATEIL